MLAKLLLDLFLSPRLGVLRGVTLIKLLLDWVRLPIEIFDASLLPSDGVAVVAVPPEVGRPPSIGVTAAVDGRLPDLGLGLGVGLVKVLFLGSPGSCQLNGEEMLIFKYLDEIPD